MNMRIFVILGLLICCGVAINSAPKQNNVVMPAHAETDSAMAKHAVVNKMNQRADQFMDYLGSLREDQRTHIYDSLASSSYADTARDCLSQHSGSAWGSFCMTLEAVSHCVTYADDITGADHERDPDTLAMCKWLKDTSAKQ